jgi:hypothetical protein
VGQGNEDPLQRPVVPRERPRGDLGLLALQQDRAGLDWRAERCLDDR